MTDWAARAAAFFASTPPKRTDETDETPVVSVLAVGSQGVVEQTARAANDTARELLARLAAAAGWSAADIADGEACIKHSPQDAAALFSEMLARLEPDDRVRCAGCRFYRGRQCWNHQAAGLESNVISDDLAHVPQHCPGFEAAERLRPAPLPVLAKHADKPEHLRRGWDAFVAMREWIKPYTDELAAAGWVGAELFAPPTTRARLDGGLCWTLAGFELERLEVSPSAIVAVDKRGGRMTYRRPRAGLTHGGFND